jgi:hypothetical protein
LLGYATTAGDFNGDGFDDLMQAIPGQLVNGEAGAGAFRVLPGMALPTALAPLGGVGVDNFQFFTQETPGVEDQAEAVDQIGLPWPNEPRAGASFFGNVAATGDFNGDNFDDLAIGVPLEDLLDPDTGAIVNAGGVHVFFGGRVPPAGLQMKINDLRNAIQNLENALP